VTNHQLESDAGHTSAHLSIKESERTFKAIFSPGEGIHLGLVPLAADGNVPTQRAAIEMAQAIERTVARLDRPRDRSPALMLAPLAIAPAVKDLTADRRA
jgi:hypothetical protein